MRASLDPTSGAIASGNAFMSMCDTTSCDFTVELVDGSLEWLT